MIGHRPSFFRRRRHCLVVARATLLTLTAGHIATAPASAAQTGQQVANAQTLTLHDVLDSALARHPLADAARARVRAARGARTTARAFGNPMLSYDVENAPFPGGNPISGVQ